MSFFTLVLPEEHGYVPLILRDIRGALTDTQWFSWPEQHDEMEEFCRTYHEQDVYFSPMLFTEPPSMKDARHVAKKNVTHCSVVYGDADDAQPEGFYVKPSLAVETSDQKWHVYWRLTDTADPQRAEELSYAVYREHRNDGMDAGYGLSKRLRVPGTTNTKYSAPFTVRMTNNKVVYGSDEFGAEYNPVALPEVKNEGVPEEVPTPFEVLNRIATDEHLMSLFMQQPIGDRSTALYTLEMKLFEAGLDSVDVFAVARSAACNKFQQDGRGEGALWKHVLASEQRFNEKEEDKQFREADDPESFRAKDITWEALDLLDEEERASLPRTFIDDYADWCKKQSKKSARQYHEASGWSILSTVFSQYGYVVPSWGKTNLNLYFLVMGHTTRSRKSTAKNFMLRVLKELSPKGGQWDYVLESDATSEALVEELARRGPDMSAIYWRDEVQALIQHAASGGYMRGFLPMLTDTYDGAVNGVLRKTGNSKRTERTDTSLVFYGMGITGQIADALTDEDFFSGFLPRVLMVIDESENTEYGSHDVEQRIENRSATEDGEFMDLILRLHDARKFWNQESGRRAGERFPVVADDDAWARWQDFTERIEKLAAQHPHRADVLSPGGQRLGVSVLKSAALLAMLDKSDRIKMDHMLVAINYGTEWARWMEQMSRQVSKTAQAKDIDELEAYVMGKAKPVPYGQALATFKGRKNVKEFNELVTYCIETGSLFLGMSGNTKTIGSTE